MSRPDASGRNTALRRPKAGGSPASGAGFTLLEVMAAVALLGILYSVLARVAIEGLRAEGESQRRIEASLLADQRLAESFEGIAGGVMMPPVGRSETTEGDFTIALEVALFEPPAEWGVGDSIEVPPLLFASSPGVPGTQALRAVQLSVSWLEGAEQRHVDRTFYLVDFERVKTLAAGFQPPAPAAGTPEAPPATGEAPAPSELELP